MNGNPNAPILTDPSMLNIRFIPVDAPTRLWQYIGLPERSYSHAERRWMLTAPTIERFADWWRAMRKEQLVPTGEYQDKPFERAQLLLGGYYNQDPNTGKLEGTMVCYPKVVEELPMPKGAVPMVLPASS